MIEVMPTEMAAEKPAVASTNNLTISFMPDGMLSTSTLEQAYDYGILAAMKMVKDPLAAEDIAIEALRILWAHADTSKTESASKQWFNTVLHNQSVSHLRRAGRISSHELPLDDTRQEEVVFVRFGSAEYTSDEAVDNKTWIDPETSFAQDSLVDSIAIRQSLVKAIELLSPAEKEIFELSDVMGLTHSEVLKRLGISSLVARGRIFRARAKLREQLESDLFGA